MVFRKSNHGLNKYIITKNKYNMKYKTLKIIIASLFITIGVNFKTNPTVIIKYDLPLFQRKLDTLQSIINVVGKSLSVDQAESYKAAGYSVISGFVRDAKIDTSQIVTPKGTSGKDR